MPTLSLRLPLGLNITERAAYAWLCASEGYTPDTLRFQRRASPDFLGADGRAWEVKLVRNRVVVFAASQLEALRDVACAVVLWGGGTQPEAVVPFADLEIPGQWRQYRLCLTGVDEHRLPLRLPPDLHDVARVAAASQRVSLSAYLLAAIRAAVLRDGLEDRAVAAVLDRIASTPGR